MDPERQIRFLYPPLFLVASLLWGLKLDHTKSIADVVPLALFKDPGTGLLALVAGGGVVVVGCGLLIGTIALLILRGGFWFFKKQPHEAVLTGETLASIQGLLGLSATQSGAADTLFIAATFDHEKLDKSIHAWLLRRWNAFNVSASSIVALVLALLIGWRLGIKLWPEWLGTSAIFGAMFFVTARWAWKDTMGMVAFQAQRLSEKRLAIQPE